jgi:hypothetical protein
MGGTGILKDFKVDQQRVVLRNKTPKKKENQYVCPIIFCNTREKHAQRIP